MKPKKDAHKTPKKLTLNALVLANGEWLASQRQMSVSELVETLLEDELRAEGVAPWGPPGSKAPAKNKGAKKDE